MYVYVIQYPEANQRWLEDASIRLLCVFALDRFADFISDQVQYTLPISYICMHMYILHVLYGYMDTCIFHIRIMSMSKCVGCGSSESNMCTVFGYVCTWYE